MGPLNCVWSCAVGRKLHFDLLCQLLFSFLIITTFSFRRSNLSRLSSVWSVLNSLCYFLHIAGHWYIPAWFRTGFNAETIEFQLIVLSPSGDILEFDPRGRRMLPPPQYDTAYKITWGYRETAEVLPDSLIQKLDLYNVAWNGWVTDILKRGKFHNT